MARAGATAIELGMPFSDPAADGPVIQRACERALATRREAEGRDRSCRACGCKPPEFRSSSSAISIRCCATALRTGAGCRRRRSCRSAGHRPSGRVGARFFAGVATARARSGFAGRSYFDRAAHRTDRATRNRFSLRHFGHRSHRHAPAVKRRCQHVARNASGASPHLPVAVGFGVSNAEQARRPGRRAPTLSIVGSAIVRRIEEYGAQAPAEVERFVRELLASQAVEA